MLSPTRGSFTLRTRRSLIPKASLAIFLLILIIQLTVYTPLLDHTGPILSNLKEDFKDPLSHYTNYGKLLNGSDSDEETSTYNETSIMDDFVWTRDFNQSFISYGTTDCIPRFDDDWIQLAIDRNRTCNSAPFPVEETKRVAIATWMVGQPQEAYLRAIGSQVFHSAVHGSTTHVRVSKAHFIYKSDVDLSRYYANDWSTVLSTK